LHMRREKVSLVLRLVDAGRAEVHAMNVLHTRNGTPLSDVVERFARHYNRRRVDGAAALDASDVTVFDDDGNRVDQASAVADLFQGLQDRVDLTLSSSASLPDDDDDDAACFPAQHDDATAAAAVSPQDDDDDDAATEAPEMRAMELPQPSEAVADKASFDTLLTGVGPDVLIVLFFERFDDPAGTKIAPSFHNMARLFWPKALMLRVDVDTTKDLVLAAGVTSIPTFVFFKNQAAVDKLQGQNEITLNVKLSKWLKPTASSPALGATSSKRDVWGAGLLAEARKQTTSRDPE